MFRTIGFTFLLLVITGCATRPIAPPQLDLEENQQAIQQFQQWQIKGRLAFKSPQDKFSANLNWQHKPDVSDINLTSFIGTQLVSLRSTSGFAELIADENHYTDVSPTRLLKRVTGWDIPVTRLSEWIKASHGKADKVQYNETGLVSTLIPACEQCGQWQISYSKYKAIQGLWLPHDVVLKQNDNHHTQIRIRINQWLKI